jgi:hypothetical protein
MQQTALVNQAKKTEVGCRSVQTNILFLCILLLEMIQAAFLLPVRASIYS